MARLTLLSAALLMSALAGCASTATQPSKSSSQFPTGAVQEEHRIRNMLTEAGQAAPAPATAARSI